MTQRSQAAALARSRLTEQDIIYQRGDYDVRRLMAGWYEVYRAGPTCATLAATFNFSDRDSYARERALRPPDHSGGECDAGC